MKLKNKKTGEIVEFLGEFHRENKPTFLSDGYTLESLCGEWTDYKEPEDYWYIDDLGRVQFSCFLLDEEDGKPNNGLIRKCYGNYFSSKETAELALRKLQAWKRLKDNGFRFDGYDDKDRSSCGDLEIYAHLDCEMEYCEKDLGLLFLTGEKNERV